MGMKTFIISFVFLLALDSVSGQDNKRYSSFEYIEDSSDSSSITLMKSQTVVSEKNSDIASMYYTIKMRARGMDANCFRFKSFTRDSSGTMTLTLDTYYAKEEFIKSNFQNHPTNTVYVIGDGEFSEKTYSFRVNGEKKIISSGTFYEVIIPSGGKAKINKGGFTGTTAIISWEEGKPCQFLSLSGFGLAGGHNALYPYATYPGGMGIGVSFTTGKLKSVERNFGLLMTDILKQVPTALYGTTD
jgi:hypothetical protein